MQMKESLAALGELSAGIAHEFKNSLATISGYAQMIRAEPKATPPKTRSGFSSRLATWLTSSPNS